MSPSEGNWARVKELVADALEKPPSARAAFLDELDAAGIEAPETRRRVRQLVQAARDDADPLEQAAATPLGAAGALGALSTDAGSSPDARGPNGPVDWSGRTVGSYAVRRFVARGGMGEVYEAQQEGTGRRVALKLLSRTSSSSWRARFRHEVSILARLEHAAIAQILDADVHVDESGRQWPYFALEYVDGPPISKFAAKRDLSVAERIELFIDVCRGVQHAHQKGVIHRDLKPENVLVAEPELAAATQGPGPAALRGRAQPKVLDFGVARLIDGVEQGTTQLTRAGELVGTLAYMSPEQLSGEPEAVDTQSDVYALGVMLFELLAGRLPLDLTGRTLPEAVDELRFGQPPRLSESHPGLDHDLETICSTAMARDKEARYQSVSELAADLERYLRREPIAARPASGVYRMRLFARRHRGLVAGLTLALVALLVGAAGTTVGFVEAKGEARRATAEAARTRAANGFLRGFLEAADPEVLGKDVTVREMLDLNAPQIDTLFAGDDRTRAEARRTVGWTYNNLGELDVALEQLEGALELFRELDGPNARETLLTEYYHQTVRLERDGASGDALERTEDLLARARAHLGELDPTTLMATSDLATVVEARGDWERAGELLRDVHSAARERYGDDHETTSILANDLGVFLLERGEYDEAAQLFEVVYAQRVRNHGRADPRSLKVLNHLATADSFADRPEKALAAFDQALEDARGVWDEDHRFFVDLRANRGLALGGLGRFDEAVEAYREVLDTRRATLGELDPLTLATLFNLSTNLAYAGRFEEAELRAREMVELTEACEGCDEDMLMRAKGQWVSLLSDLGQMEEAVPLSEEVLADFHRIRGPEHFETLVQGNNHAGILNKIGRHEDAIAQFEQVIASWVKEYPEVISVERTFRWNYGRALADAGRYADSESQFLLVMEQEEAAGPSSSPPREKLLERMIELYEAWGRDSEAQRVRGELAGLLEGAAEMADVDGATSE